VVTLAIWGEVTSWATLTICGVWGDMVDVITCAIFGYCRLRGVGVVRKATSPSPIYLTRRSYNTTMWPCDRVIHTNQWRSDTFGRPVRMSKFACLPSLEILENLFSSTVYIFLLCTISLFVCLMFHFFLILFLLPFVVNKDVHNTATRSVSQHKASNFHFQFQSGRRLPWLRWHHNLSICFGSFAALSYVCLADKRCTMRQN